MARTPSKITKRDIDKNLYMEIVSEANNKTNIQKLLDERFKATGVQNVYMPMLIPESMLFSFTPRIFRTLSACPFSIWSITVPFLIGGILISMSSASFISLPPVWSTGWPS